MTETMTVAQAIVRYLVAEGVEYVLGSLGHGNLVLGEAIHAARAKLRFVPVRNEQNAVLMAAAYARMTGRPVAVTTAIGPGATSLVTGCAMARVSRLPVLLLPADVFDDGQGPVSQQIEGAVETSANDCLKPVARYFSRVTQPSQLRRRLREAFDAMMTPGEMGPAVLSLPIDVQAMTYGFDRDLTFAARDRDMGRVVPDEAKIIEAAKWLREARRPLIVAGGGTYYSRAWETLTDLAELVGIPVATTQSGTGVMLDEHPLSVYGIGATGSSVANRLARKADLVIGVGTRWTDLATASDTAFARDVRFLNVNISAFDVGKQNAVKLWGDARLTISALVDQLRDSKHPRAGTGTGPGYKSTTTWFKEVQRLRDGWRRERQKWLDLDGDPLPQSRAIAIVNESIGTRGTVTLAAGSLPGDLQRLWRSEDPARQAYYCEHGFQVPGSAIAGAIGVKLALPGRPVTALVGDMSFLWAPQEIATAVQLKLPITVVVFDNRGGQSVRGLQRESGFADFGTEPRIEGKEDAQAVDFARIAEGMGAIGLSASTADELESALDRGKASKDRPVVIHLRVDRDNRMGSYDTWRDVPRPENWSKGEKKTQLDGYRKLKSGQIVR